MLLDGAFVAGDRRTLFHHELIEHLAPRDETAEGRALCGTLIVDETTARYRIDAHGGAKDEPSDDAEQVIARWIANCQPVGTITKGRQPPGSKPSGPLAGGFASPSSSKMTPSFG